jgi:hypothetical protein
MLPSSKVKTLQKTLAAYAQATGFSAANPGAIDGFVGTQTINAVVAMIPLIPQMPSEVRALAILAPILMTDPSARKKAVEYVTKYADDIAKGIIGLAAYQVATGKLPTTQTAPSGAGIKTVGPYLPGSAWVASAPTGSPSAIFFYDAGRGTYRIAVPAGLRGLSAAYVELAPSGTRPGQGTEVSKTKFLNAIGDWYKTPMGITGIVLGSLAVVGGGVLVVRALR